MATVAGVKVKAKPRKIRNPLLGDEKYTGVEPQWPVESEKWPDEQFDSFLRRCFYYYNYHYTQKDCKKYITEWMRNQKQFTPEQVRQFERASEKWLPMTACSLVMAHRQGMQLRERHTQYLTDQLTRLIETRQDEDKEDTPKGSAVAAVRYTIQDRLAEKTNELIGELENCYDEMDKTNIKFYDWFMSKNVVATQLNKYEDVFQGYRKELELAQSKTDPQLVEGYSHYRPADFKKRLAWIDDLMGAIDQYRNVKKATKRARIKKAPSKEKLVSKLKYAKENKTLKVVSINPAEIVGATELWVYNAKTRKLGKYVAESHQTLSVKGTGIANYDTDKSVSKTLRKPEEQLKAFAKAGKVALRTFIKDIKAVEIKLNGRINTDTLLLLAM